MLIQILSGCDLVGTCAMHMRKEIRVADNEGEINIFLKL